MNPASISPQPNSQPHTNDACFSELEARLDSLLDLLKEAHAQQWLGPMQRAHHLIRQRDLAGAALLLDAYRAGHGFSTLVLAERLQTRNPARYVILNHKLEHLRTSIFVVAGELASARPRGH